MTSVDDLVTDLDDADVAILKGLMARLGARSADPWPPRIEAVFRGLAGALDDELDRRRRMVQDLLDTTGEGGVGGLASEPEDLSGWTSDTSDDAA